MDEAKMPADDAVDLGQVALALTVRSAGYALLGVFAAVAAVLIARVAGHDRITNAGFWRFAAAVWAVLQVDIFLRLRRVARTSPPVRSSAGTIHKLEFVTAGFMLLYSLARPYLLESDASAYPYVQRMFQLIIGVTACFHVFVLATFRAKPGKWDVAALAAALIAAVFPLLR